MTIKWYTEEDICCLHLIVGYYLNKNVLQSVCHLLKQTSADEQTDNSCDLYEAVCLFRWHHKIFFKDTGV